jgi:hypothetical protein
MRTQQQVMSSSNPLSIAVVMVMSHQIQVLNPGLLFQD